MSNEKKERYNLQKAAKIMAQGEIAGRSELLLRNLKQSVKDGNFKVFQSGSNIRYKHDMDEKTCSDILCSDVDMAGGLTWVDKLYDERLSDVLHYLPNDLEVYWDDLNVWIEDNEPRIGPIFQNPDNSAASAGLKCIC